MIGLTVAFVVILSVSTQSCAWRCESRSHKKTMDRIKVQAKTSQESTHQIVS